MDEKAIKAIQQNIIDRSYDMAVAIYKGDRVETIPQPDCDVKNLLVRREIMKTGR